MVENKILPLSSLITRRNFLGVSGAGLIAAGVGLTASKSAQAAGSGTMDKKLPASIPLPSLNSPTELENREAPNQLPPSKKLGVAIVGLGRLSLDQILPSFGQSKWCRPVALVSGDVDKARRVAEQYGIGANAIYDYKDYDNIKNNPEIEIVYVVLPNSMHAEYTVRAFRAGKHVLCEKPMATSVHECEQMIQAGHAAGKKLMIAYRIQYEPHNRKVRELIHQKKLGKIKLIQMDNGQNQGDPSQWRLKKALAGGGALPDVGIYCLNTARFLTGEEPVEISARVSTTPDDPRFTEVEESVFWSMKFPSGISALCSTSYGYHEARRYRVLGSDAWADLDPAFPYEGLRLRVGRHSRENPDANSLDELKLPIKNHFAHEMDHMAECVANDKTPYTPGEEGLQDQRLIDAIYESARSGQIVRFPAVAGLDHFRGRA